MAFTIEWTSETRFTYGTVVCLTLFCIGAHFALFPNVLKQIYGKQATPLYGIMMTGTGVASTVIVGLILSPVGLKFFLMFYISGALSIVALIILVTVFKQKRYEPDWSLIMIDEQEQLKIAEQIEDQIKLTMS